GDGRVEGAIDVSTDAAHIRAGRARAGAGSGAGRRHAGAAGQHQGREQAGRPSQETTAADGSLDHVPPPRRSSGYVDDDSEGTRQLGAPEARPEGVGKNACREEDGTRVATPKTG